MRQSGLSVSDRGNYFQQTVYYYLNRTWENGRTQKKIKDNRDAKIMGFFAFNNENDAKKHLHYFANLRHS